MGKKIGNLLFFLLVTAAAVGLTFYVGQGQMDVMLYNFIFLAVMVVLYLFGMFAGMFRLHSLKSAFKRAAEDVRSIFKRPGKTDLGNLGVLKEVFGYKYLDRRMEHYLSGIRHTAEGIDDIEEYINEDEIDSHLHKRFLEMIPDIFTSLGILGTFVGLVWGLKDFRPTDYASMTTSVSSLVDGIKVAFLTSIYGIAFSIIYSTCMRSAYSAMSDSLNTFLDYFHRYVRPTADSESRNLLVSSQKTQTEAMLRMTEQFSSQLADSFEKVITPTFQKMNDSLDSLISKVTQCQEEAIRQIVNEFLQQMNASMGSSLTDFGKTVERLTQIQRENAEYTVQLYQSVSSQITESYNRQDRAMQTMLRELSDAQNQYLSNAGKILKENQEIQLSQQQDYQHVVDFLKESEKTASKFWVACNQTMKNYVETAAQSMDSASHAAQISEELVRSCEEIAQTFSERMKDYVQYQNLTYKTMEKVRILLSDIAVAKPNQDVYLVGNSQNDMAVRIERVLGEQAESQQQVMNEINRSLREVNKSLQKGKLSLFGK